MPRRPLGTRLVIAIATVWLLLIAGSPFALAVTGVQPKSWPAKAPVVNGSTGISAVSQRDGHLDVFWIGPDGTVRSNWWDSAPNGAWGTHGQFNITPPNSAALQSGVAAVSQRNGHLDVFWIGPDGSVRSHWWDSAPSGAWGTHGQFNIAPPNSAAPNSAITAVSQRDGHLDVFWIGPDGTVRSNWWDSDPNGAWAKHQPFNITPPNSAAPNAGISAVSQRNGHLDVFWAGPDGTVRSHWWDSAPSGAWGTHGQFNITPPNSAAPNTGVTAVAQRDNHLDVFWAGPDGTVRSHWWDSAPSGAWGTHGQFNITPPNSAAVPGGSTQPQPPPPPPPPPSDEQRFLDQINSARQKYGCTPLRTDPKLTETARAHSEDLAAHPDLTAAGLTNRGHVGSDGSLAWDDNGNQGRIHRDLGSEAARAQGENVHWGKGDTFERAMDDWMNHDEASKWGHKYNIMGCDPDDPNNPYSNGAIASYNPPPTAGYRLVGVGIATAADGTVYITQDFAG
ncbi:CAP domain-containing protein [Streptomyces sp. NPDC058734]|uniref:CAP domain-containing protein n=1 Tax=Streptomyces sp. NPDC058734 TaxID=3346615 RepID=UPI0036B7F330